jgi:hypothetical protein
MARTRMTFRECRMAIRGDSRRLKDSWRWQEPTSLEEIAICTWEVTESSRL